MSTPILPVYFELSWSILSTIGASNVLLGLLVVGITSFSQITVVPIISSAAGSIANGLCYYAFYDESPSLKHKAAASAFADVFWVVRMEDSSERENELTRLRSKKLACRFTAMPSSEEY
ncbi:uncharacterized protein ColSpa_09893 [Colletotrichum spaethianum]|uniref:Uncharacterized protein n=1 Tax=Colletotrichum spaethianum TaxID=700344 RepID=A0AA37UQZ0_9PEZI|nr:uncharacterized protein ColSpa_09893 [Colletotrichum spaethianum]GKT49712.1 hypothetical protein ColSpa_09893 [Colletotrichum spaethianum]